MDRLATMEAFVRVVEAGSFSGAAKQLRIGQPAVSKTIAQLEDRLGVRLLLRSTRGLTPTEAGQGFYERARRAIEEADEAELAARGAGSALSGRLRICGPLSDLLLRATSPWRGMGVAAGDSGVPRRQFCRVGHASVRHAPAR
jgi:DNA-binding transcriptional LysR family regulator